MSKARHVHTGDWIKVDGRTVKVTAAHTIEGQRQISYKGRAKSGMLRRDPGDNVKHVYRGGWKW